MGFMDVWGFDPDQLPSVRRSAEEQLLDFTYHNEDEPAAQIPLAGSDQIRDLWRIFELAPEHGGPDRRAHGCTAKSAWACRTRDHDGLHARRDRR